MVFCPTHKILVILVESSNGLMGLIALDHYSVTQSYLLNAILDYVRL